MKQFIFFACLRLATCSGCGDMDVKLKMMIMMMMTMMTETFLNRLCFMFVQFV